MKLLIVSLISYLLGSFSSSYILAKKKKGIDIREHGSGNAGTTNALRVLGKKYAALTFLMDFIKGFVAVRLASVYAGYDGMLLATFFVVMGHNYSIYLSFKGGKGIATSIGVLFAIDWRIGLVTVIIGLITVYLSGYVSLGSILGSLMAPIALNLIDGPVERKLNITIIILAFFAIIRHRSNISRLLKGEENKLK